MKKSLNLLGGIFLLILVACSDQSSSNSRSTIFLCGEGEEATVKERSELSDAEKEECREVELEENPDLLGPRRSGLD